MLLQDLLLKKLNVSSDIEQKLVRAIDKWIDWVKDSNEYKSSNRPYLSNQQGREYGNKIQRILQPTINKILRDNLYIDESNLDENCKGFKLSLKVDIDLYDTTLSTSGSVSGVWSKWWLTKPEYFFGATYEIVIPITTLHNLVNGSENAKQSLLATMTHELIHAMQLARTKLRRIKSSQKVSVQNKLDKDQRYYLNKIELNAYAQGTVTKILNKARTMPNGTEWITKLIFPMLTNGMNSVFGREVFPTQRYEEIRDLCRQPTDDPEIKKLQKESWRYFNKRIYEKLIDHLEQQNKPK